MSPSTIEYVQKTSEGGWRIADSRVSLDSVVHAFWEGKTPEAIAEDFETLSSEQIYGAIAYYLRNRSEIDGYLEKQSAHWETQTAASNMANRPLLDRLRNRGRTSPVE